MWNWNKKNKNVTLKKHFSCWDLSFLFLYYDFYGKSRLLVSSTFYVVREKERKKKRTYLRGRRWLAEPIPACPGSGSVGQMCVKSAGICRYPSCSAVRFCLKKWTRWTNWNSLTLIPKLWRIFGWRRGEERPVRGFFKNVFQQRRVIQRTPLVSCRG